MSNYDSKIKAKKEMISKLLSDIESKKVKVSKVKAEIKQLEAEKNEEFSREFMKKLSEVGYNTADERQALLSQIEEFALEREIEKAEKKENSLASEKTETDEKANLIENRQNEKS